MGSSLKLKNSIVAILIVLLSAVVFAESSIPYFYAEHKTVPGNKFLGQVIYTPDQDMYFSFIRQARDGNFVFSNRLTYIHNEPAFVNLQFWLIGTTQRITGLSENGIYYVWRYLGILLLTIGITLLARIILPAAGRLWACVVILLFTGGFGFIFAFLGSMHLISLDVVHAGILDMRYGFLPFQQAVTNPNFSFPHGLILIAYALFLLGEREGRKAYYIWCGILFIIIGLVRPYDIIPPVAIFPVYLLVTSGLRFELQTLLRKFLPLLIMIPVFLYNVWLFKFNAAFKDWSTQGLNADSLPSVIWHYLAYGVVGILAIIRIAQIKTNPLSKNDKFLLVWFLVTFICIHLGKYFPVIGWSPQIGVYLAVPLALLGCSIKYQPVRKLSYCAVIAVITFCVIAGNISILLYYTKNFKDPAKTPIFYASENELAAWQWLQQNTKQGDVVLAMPSTSLRIAKYTDNNVVAAHYSVTPHFVETANLAGNLYSSPALAGKHSIMKDTLHVSYLYIGPLEEQTAHNNIVLDAGYTKVYSNPLVAIYKVN